MKSLLIIFCLALSVTGCYNDKAEKLYVAPAGNNSTTCNTTSVSYAATVKPIIDQSCAISGCHDANSPNGFFLNDYTHTHTYALNGQLVGTITHAVGLPAMPLGGASLSACQISQIEAWVNAGYPNN